MIEGVDDLMSELGDMDIEEGTKELLSMINSYQSRLENFYNILRLKNHTQLIYRLEWERQTQIPNE